MKHARFVYPMGLTLAIAFCLSAYFPLASSSANSPARVLPSASKPLVNLKTPTTAKFTYTGSANAVTALQEGAANPTALASTDFDADGAMDVVAGYSTENGGVLALYMGNRDAFAPTDPSLYQKAMEGNVPPTFLPKAAVFTLPESPDLIETGDFNRDGYKDVLVAARGGSLYFLAGDGHGNLRAPQLVALADQVMALAATPDGHVAVSTDGRSGPLVNLLAPGIGGLVAERTFSLPARGVSLAWGSLGGGVDLAVAAGSNVTMIYGALSANAQTETVPVPYAVQALALGDYIWDRDGRTEIAALAGDGSIHILQHGTLDTRPVNAADVPARRAAYGRANKRGAGRRQPNPMALGAWSEAKELPTAVSPVKGGVSASAFSSPRLAASSTNDLMVIDAGKNLIRVLDTSGATASASADISFSGTPVAALALPQKIGTGRDIVVLTSAQVAPMLVPSNPTFTFNVNTTADIDSVNACATNSTVTTPPATLSLREAVCIANNNGASTVTINVPAGTYDLAISTFGGNDSASSSPELQVGIQNGNNITISGAGASSTIIQQTATGSRIIEADELLKGSQPLVIQYLTLQDGNCTDSGLDCLDNGGGAILAGGATGDTLTITNVDFNHNSTQSAAGTLGGAVEYTGSLLSITGSTFSQNTASGTGGAQGGAVQVEDVIKGSQVPGSVTIINSTFSGNSAISGNNGNANGGGLYFEGAAGFDGSVTGSTFTGNTASSTAPTGAATGGAITAGGGGTDTFSVSNSRIVSNSVSASSAVASGYYEFGLVATVNNNWWGCNGGPGASGCDTVFFDLADGGSGTFTPWLVLSVSANPTQIIPNATSTLTGDLTHNSSGTGGFSVPDGTPVTFGGTLDSSVNPTSTSLTSGQAASTYTAGNSPGAGSGTATVDNATVSVPINIVPPPVLAITKSAVGAFTQGQTAEWDVTVNNTATGSATSGTVNVQDVMPSGYTISSIIIPASFNCSSSTSTTVTCTSTQVVTGGSSYPTIKIMVSVPSNSPILVTNTVATWGGGDTIHNSLGSAATTSNTVTVTQVPASVTPTGGTPQSTAAGTAFGLPLAAVVKDAGGVAINGATVVFLAPSTGASGTFSNGTITISPSTNASGAVSETFAANSIPGGPYTVTATAGSAVGNFLLTNLTVGTPTTTSVSSNNNPSFTGAPNNSVTFTATVTSNSTVNEGTVTFSDPANNFTCSGGNTVPVSNGQAACTTSFSTEGADTITATYNGTVNFQSSHGSLTQAVNNHTVVNGNQFCNQGTVSVPSATGEATPYPSEVFISGYPGTVSTVTVQLNNISSNDIPLTDLLLVGPTGAAIVPFANIGNSASISGVNIGLDDSASSLLPSGTTLTSGTFKPSAFTSSLSFPAPAPATFSYAATSGTATLTTLFGNTSPNGTWELFAIANADGGAATIGGGWCVTVPAAPTTTTASNARVPFSSSNQSVALAATVTSGAGTVSAGTVTFSVFNGMTQIGSSTGPAAVSNGSASANYTLPGGTAANTYTIVASYSGGGGFNSSSDNTHTLTVVAPPTITKSFSPTSIPVGGVSTLSLTLTNPNASVTLTGVSFSDTMPSGMQVANPAGIGSTCSGTWNATPGDTFLNFGGGTLPPGSSCTLTVNVTSITAGTENNVTNPPQSNEGGTGVSSNTATLTVIAPPGISKAFELLSTIAASPTGATESGPTVTITTTSPHGFATGQSVTIAGVGVVGYNGTFTIASVPTTTTFTYTDTNTGLAASGGGTATVPITTMPLNSTATLAFTLTNPNPTALTGVSFTDALPSGLQVATTPNASAPCGTFAPNAGATTLSFSAGTLASSATCIVSVNITGTTAGVKNNTTGNVTSTQGGTGGTASATVTVLSPPSISKAFGVANIPPGGTTTLTFTITNPNAANQLLGVGFTDPLPSGLAVASTPGASTSCGGTFAPNAGDTTLNFSGATIAAAGTCTVSVNITGTTPGVKNNTTGAVTSTNAGTGNTASASITVASPPTITKAFGASSILVNGTTSLTFTITNPNTSLGLTGISFTDSLPAGMTVPNGTTTPCGGSLTAASNVLTFSGGSITASGNCSFSVTVTGSTAGVWNNTTGAISSNESGAGTTSNTATLTVVAPPTISKSFDAATIPLNGTSVLSFTITNNNSTTTLTGIGFTDTLPAGLTVASGTSSTCGGGTLTATAPGTIALTGGSIAASSTCVISVTVTGATAGVKNNTTGAITSTNGGTGTTSNTATITVVAPPTISKGFGAPNIALNGTTSLTFTLTNPNSTVALVGVAFTDKLPPGLTVPTTGAQPACGGGVLTSTAPGTITLSGGTIAASGTCSFSVTVTGATSGVKNNTTGAVTSTNGGTGNMASASITVASPPTISKAFGAPAIPLNGTTSLTFTITNPNASIGLTGVGFTDALPAGMTVASGTSTTCNGGTLTTTSPGTISLSGGTIAASGMCSFSVTVTGSTAGIKNNTTGAITSNEGGTGTTSNTATITVVAPPAISKVFGAGSIPLNGTTSLSFTIQNNNVTTTLTGIGFTDTLPAGLAVSTPNGLSGSCGGGTITATAGTGVISLSGASLATSASCIFSVNVSGSTAGAKNNTTGNVTSNEGGTGNTASASLAVVAPPTISKMFGAPSILLGASTSLTFTITNPAANSVAEAGVAFADTLPAGLVVATPNGLANNCGGAVTATAGTSSISLTGGSVATSSSCTLVVNVTSTTYGVKNNTTGPVSSTNGGTGATSNTATLSVSQPPAFTSANSATFTIGVAGSFTVTTTGFPTPSITEAGHLPTGLSFVDNGNGTGTLSGTPMIFDGGDFGISFTAQNGVGSPATQPFTIIVQQPPSFTSANNTVFVYGVPNSFTVTTAAFPVASIHESGTLPPWLTFVDNGNGTATLSGTPTLSSGTFALVLTAANVVTSVQQNFTLMVSGLSLSPSNLVFGTVYLNSSTTLPVTVTNVGSTTVSVSSVSITPGTANAAAYTAVNHCTTPLKAGKSCIIDVTFKANAEGTLTATLNLTDNTVGSPQHIGLTGNVIDPVAQFNPTKLAFGTVTVHSSASLPVQLTNSGQTPLDISNISIGGTDAGDFSQSNSCPAILAATMSCTISVTFDPTVKGARSGTLIVTDNVAAGKSTVALTGTGH